MPDLIVKSMERPDETRAPSDAGRVELTTLGETVVSRATFQPGWRWTQDVKPHAGSDLCQAAHVGYVVSGRSKVRMADGTEVELGPGDTYVIPAGHDAWVLGDEPYVSVDFSGPSPAAAAKWGQ